MYRRRCEFRVALLGFGFGVWGLGCTVQGIGFEERTDDEVAIDNLMEVGSHFMHFAVQKHPACRGPQFHLDDCTTFKEEKSSETRRNNLDNYTTFKK